MGLCVVDLITPSPYEGNESHLIKDNRTKSVENMNLRKLIERLRDRRARLDPNFLDAILDGRHDKVVVMCVPVYSHLVNDGLL